MARDYLWAAGVMTGNSLDGADAVLTRFGLDGSIKDFASEGTAYPQPLSSALRTLRDALHAANGDAAQAQSAFERQAGAGAFSQLHRDYLGLVARTVLSLAQKAQEPIDLLGFHGQTCGHLPPSVAKSQDPRSVYTAQLGDGQALADLTGLTVVYDFRSDDLMTGGEAAPFATRHHQHLARAARARGQFPLAFVNAGNTGNLSVITHDPRTHTQVTLGWDAGPFNHYPDALVRREKDEPCDRDGRYGGAGRVHVELLRRLFDSAAVTRDGKNYLLLPPPKSSDPEWYRLPAELSGEPPVGGQGLTFEDRVRTAEYFAAYVCFHALCGLPEALEMPGHYALCGGGWRNPVVRAHFEALMRGDGSSPVLPEHQTLFSRARQRLQAHGTLSIEAAEAYGFDGTVMEARAFADAAVCRITGEPFTDTAITGVPRPAVCGLIRFPGGDEAKATPALRAWLDRYRSRTLTREPPGTHHPCWSRAVAGWSDRFTS